MNSPVSRRPIGQILITQGVISEDQLRIALLEQMKSNQPVGKLLVSLGFVSEATLRDALGESLGQKSVDLANSIVDPEALRLVPRDLAKRHLFLPLSYSATDQRLRIATADPNDIVALDKLRTLIHPEPVIETLLAGESEIAHAIDQYYGHELSIDGILHEIETGEIDYRSLSASLDEYSQPVVRLVDALLTDAVKRDASDVHFEPEASFLRIRYRIDGILRQIRALHKSYWAAMAVRIKVMSGMNIAETRAPQDGRISLNISGHAVDFRVASQPTIHGENIVLRILDRDKGIVPLDALGLDPAQRAALDRILARPEGLILVVGPTGSGKTTTLYSMLGHLNTEAVNIMTLEDPVEYPLALIRQTQVGDASRLDFADGVRALLRQDPDVILIGEIRDADTATMALRAALTGHQVFATLHANSIFGALPRLHEIGIGAELLAGNLCGILAQRLVRRLCPTCREPVPDDAPERHLPGLAADAPPAPSWRARGCPECDFRGYRGRLAIMEILPFDAELDELVARRASPGELRAAARTRGHRSLAEDGLRRVLDGSTSLAELARVVDLSALAATAKTAHGGEA